MVNSHCGFGLDLGAKHMRLRGQPPMIMVIVMVLRPGHRVLLGLGLVITVCAFHIKGYAGDVVQGEGAKYSLALG